MFKTRISNQGNFLLNIPKLKSDIRVQAHREIPGQINNLVISNAGNPQPMCPTPISCFLLQKFRSKALKCLQGTDKYFVSFSCQVDKQKIPGTDTQCKNQNEIGIDLGLKDTIVTSTGEKIHNPRHLEKSLKKLKKESRRLSRHIAGAGMSELIRQIQYKSKWRNRQVVQIGRFEPSSKMCSTPGCTYIKPDLKLSEREWICPKCGILHDRDINAALNILKIGRDYARINACGENNRCFDLKRSFQVGSMKQEPYPVV